MIEVLQALWCKNKSFRNVEQAFRWIGVRVGDGRVQLPAASQQGVLQAPAPRSP